MNATRIRFQAKLERKHPRLPVYVVVPAEHARALDLRATGVVEGVVNGHDIGRRSIKRWDDSDRSPWFVEFTMPFCHKAAVVVGDTLDVSLWLADTGLPEALADALAQSSGLRAAWESLSGYSRRTAAEHVRAGKSAATRSRRAAAIVRRLAPSEAPPQSVT